MLEAVTVGLIIGYFIIFAAVIQIEKDGLLGGALWPVRFLLDVLLRRFLD